MAYSGRLLWFWKHHNHAGPYSMAYLMESVPTLPAHSQGPISIHFFRLDEAGRAMDTSFTILFIPHYLSCRQYEKNLASDKSAHFWGRVTWKLRTFRGWKCSAEPSALPTQGRQKRRLRSEKRYWLLRTMSCWYSRYRLRALLRLGSRD